MLQKSKNAPLIKRQTLNRRTNNEIFRNIQVDSNSVSGQLIHAMSFDAMAAIGIYPSLVSDVKCLHATRRLRSVKDKVVMLDR